MNTDSAAVLLTCLSSRMNQFAHVSKLTLVPDQSIKPA
jgi:hypothetical protein